MRKLVFGSFAKLALMGITALGVSVSAHAEVSDLRIRFQAGCVTENTTGGCSIRISASGSDFDAGDRVVLYASSGPNLPMRRVSNHWRYLGDRGTTVANLKNIPGACFQVRTWTQQDDASLRFRPIFNRAGYVDDGLNNSQTRYGSDRSHSTLLANTTNARVSSNVICEPSRGTPSSN